MTGYGLNFDLELYSPDNSSTPKAASYLPANQTDSVSYVSDTAGYWRIRVFINSGEGQYTIYVSVHSSGGWEPPPGEPDPENVGEA